MAVTDFTSRKNEGSKNIQIEIPETSHLFPFRGSKFAPLHCTLICFFGGPLHDKPDRVKTTVVLPNHLGEWER